MKPVILALSMALCINNAFAGEWSYEGHNGPEHWGELAPKNLKCKIGLEQSPIDLGRAYENDDLAKIKFDYQPQSLTVKNNGHAVQVDVNNGSQILIGKDKYRLLQFHFHTGSEHTINGRQYPMEVHFVHANDQGELAVFGMLFEEGEANRDLEAIIRNVPSTAGENVVENGQIDLRRLIGNKTRDEYYTYSGSLTTPPCSEGVRWLVDTKIRKASREQIEVLSHAVHGNNARPVQSLNGRTLQLSDD